MQNKATLVILFSTSHNTKPLLENPKVSDNRFVTITVIKISDLKHREEKLYRVCKK